MDNQQQFQPILRGELSPSGQGNSQPLSSEQFQGFAAAGQQHLNGMTQPARGAPILGQQYGVYTPPSQAGVWEGIKKSAYEATRQPWGGQTINPRTSSPVNFHKPDKFAVTTRAPGQAGLTAPHSMNETQFGSVMDQARKAYRPQLSRGGAYLGVFHDADKGTVDIDPVTVVGGASEQAGRLKAQQVAAATHSTGGAYHFASGNGVWPPHVNIQEGLNGAG